MGAQVSGPILYQNKRIPDWENDSKFDSQEGFEGQRKPRVMIATQEEMVSAKVPPQYRDYCAHLWIKLQSCKKQKAPFFYRCHHERHEYETCQYDDMIIRMKEFEREKRLLAREAERERLEIARKEREIQKEHEEKHAVAAH